MKYCRRHGVVTLNGFLTHHYSITMYVDIDSQTNNIIFNLSKYRIFIFSSALGGFRRRRFQFGVLRLLLHAAIFVFVFIRRQLAFARRAQH